VDITFKQSIQFTGLAGRASEETINGVAECTVGAQQDFAQMTRTVRIMVLRYAMARLQEFKQEAQQRNLYLLGSDVKVELNNLIDQFTTNFLDIIYQEILKTLEGFRPGGERIVDELMGFEEISGKELRMIIREYVSNLQAGELLDLNRKSSVSSLIPTGLQKYRKPVEKEAVVLISDFNLKN
jgi:ATP-dependent Zn protease